MTHKFYLLLSLVFCLSIVEINGQYCRPSLLWEVDLDNNYILRWEIPSVEVCEITHWLVYMQHNENGTQHIHKATEKELDLSFLPKCESMRFKIASVSSDNVEGDGITFFKILPLPVNANLVLTSLRIVPRNESALLEWDMEEDLIHCAKHFRVLIYDADIDYPRDIYVTTTSTVIPDLTPCGSYEFAVTPMYNVETPGRGTLLRYSTPESPQSAPTLRRINVGSTTIDLTWILQSNNENRCAVTAITVESLPFFSVTYPVQDQINRPSISTLLTNLQPDTMYILNVTTRNSAGYSQPFRIAVQTLESN